MDECEEVVGPSVVSCCDASKVFELVEASLDAVAGFVDLEVVWDRAFPARVAGNDSRRTGIGDEAADCIAVKCLICKHVVWLEAVEESWRLRRIASLAGRQDDPQGPALRIGGQVDFGGQSTSGTPQSLILAPPFPVAAC